MAPARTAVRSAKGRRPRNEDAALALRLCDGRLAVAVADGMGGHRAGDVASRAAVEALHRALKAEPESDDRAALENAFRAASDAVTEAAKGEGRDGMGTTLVVALVRGREAWVAHAGDSRAVLVLPDGVVALTEDHTVVNDALRAGQITEEEARVHPYRHAVSRSLGEGPVEPDVRHVSTEQLGGAPTAVLLLGSDGLFNHVSEAEILDAFARAPDLDAAAARLVLAAIENGGDDNVTAVAARLEAEAEAAGSSRSRRGLGSLLVLLVLGIVVILTVAYQTVDGWTRSRRQDVSSSGDPR